MTLTRTKPANWVSGEQLTYPQINSIDTEVSKALDKTTAGDTIEGTIVVSGTAAINLSSGSSLLIPTGALMNAQAGSTVVLAGGNTISGPTALSGTTTVSGAATVTGSIKVDDGILYGYTARTLQRRIPGMTGKWQGANWQPGKGVNSTQVTQVGGGESVMFHVSAPNGSTITAVDVYFKPATGHTFTVGNPVQPIMKLWHTHGTAAVDTLEGSVSDAQSTLSAYQLAHAISITGLSLVVDAANDQYAIEIIGEDGGNFVGGLTIYCCHVYFSTTLVDEGAS